MIVYSIDPGTTTGICVWDSEDDEYDPYIIDHVGPHEHHNELYESLVDWDADIVVCESFTFRPNPNRKLVVLDSREYIGVAKLYCQRRNKTYAEQQPSQAKGFWTDEKIKKLGLWKPSMRHGMDALRHLLYYRTFKLGHKQLLEGLKDL